MHVCMCVFTCFSSCVSVCFCVFVHIKYIINKSM